MNKKTKFISLILVLTIVCSIAVTGCGKKTNSNGNSNNSNTSSVLKIGVVKKGYGDEFAYKLAEAFEKKTGIKTEVAKSNASTWTDTALKSGAKNNDIDVIFDINALAMKQVATKEVVSGYDRLYADLSDIYDAPLVGYDTDATLKELTHPYALRASTWGGENEGYGDGKQYFVSWASAFEGLVYNKTLFEKYNLPIPKTTNEMFEVMEQIKTLNKGSYAKNADGYVIYPLTYSGKINYLNYLQYIWWAQYDGIDTFNNILQGKDANGNYTADSAKTPGKLSAFSIVSKMLDQDKKYADPNSASMSFTDAQVLLLAEQAFMMSTGDWVEREMSSNFDGTVGIEFMLLPINSDIIDKCTTITTDEQLSEVVSYIDGDIQEKPSYVSDQDLAYVRSARTINCCEANGHICYIPAYSDNIEAGKQFLQYMLSKEGQEIMMEYSYGNSAMLNINYTQFDYYNKLSALQRSKYDIWAREDGVRFVGKNYVHPMNYAGGLELFTNFMEASFAVPKSSSSYMTAREFWMKEYESVAGRFDNMMDLAGVSN